MSDTPRTDAGLEYDDTNIDDVKDFARQLERELNTANQRIKRLEEGGDKAILNSYMPDRLAVWNKAKEAK